MPKSPSYLPTLLELYVAGASSGPVVVSTEKLGSSVGLSQQAVSKHLIQLERDGLIVRKRSGRRAATLLTQKGSDRVVSMYSRLKRSVEGQRAMTFHGRLFTGLGEGGYYISVQGYRRQFRKLFGFDPFPGTLNITLDQTEVEMRRQLKFLPGLEVAGFEDKKRTYGPVKCFRAKVNGKENAGVLLIERTHHGETVMELIARVNLRQKLSLKDGDEVSVTVYPSD
ncbi:MAG: CTP-dependent riboflavin kinase [Nitrososphaerales archaeon]|nr:CTP-dependent riboflavin kinase [Nitrososphaerales archaeon]